MDKLGKSECTRASEDQTADMKDAGAKRDGQIKDGAERY